MIDSDYLKEGRVPSVARIMWVEALRVVCRRAHREHGFDIGDQLGLLRLGESQSLVVLHLPERQPSRTPFPLMEAIHSLGMHGKQCCTRPVTPWSILDPDRAPNRCGLHGDGRVAILFCTVKENCSARRWKMGSSEVYAARVRIETLCPAAAGVSVTPSMDTLLMRIGSPMLRTVPGNVADSAIDVDWLMREFVQPCST